MLTDAEPGLRHGRAQMCRTKPTPADAPATLGRICDGARHPAGA